MRTKKIAVAIVIVGIVLIIGIFAYNKPQSIHNPESITIGFIGPLTGDAANLGETALAGAQLAVEEINQRGGINGAKVQLIAEDTRCEATGGTNAVNKLIHVDRVDGIVGGLCSAATTPAAPIAQSAGVPLIAYCASAPEITKVGDAIFRVYPSDTAQSVFAARYVYEQMNARKVALVYIKNSWGEGLREGFFETFTNLGGEIVYAGGFIAEERDFRTELTKVKATEADVIVAYLQPEGGIAFLKQTNELAVQKPILGGDFWSEPKVVTGAGVAADGVLYTVGDTDASPAFAAKFQESTGLEAAICSANAYDAIRVLEGALTQREYVHEVITAIQNTSFEGASGHIRFDEWGDLANPSFVVKQIRGGETTTVE